MLYHTQLNVYVWYQIKIWWRHQMEAFSTLLAFCAGNSPVTDEFPAQRPATRSFDVFFDLRLNKQSWGWWFETPSRTLWRHCNESRDIVSVINPKALQRVFNFATMNNRWSTTKHILRTRAFFAKNMLPHNADDAQLLSRSVSSFFEVLRRLYGANS